MTAVTRIQRVLGAVNLTLIVVLAITGMFMALFYRADPIDAYASSLRIQNSIYLGRLARGLHWHAANILILTGFGHVCTYLVPSWVRHTAGRSLAVFTVAVPAIVTGGVLPWDQTAYWATQRLLFLIGTIPLLGPLLVGDGTPVVTAGILRAAWQLHVFILPGVGALLFFYYLFRKGAKHAPRA